MNYSAKIFSLALIALVAFVGCKEDNDTDPANGNLSLTLGNLPDLGDGYAYEGWIMVDGSPVTTGTFTINASGNLSSSVFTVDEDMLQAATAFILTIEPSPDNDPAPSDVHVLAGDFSANTATLTIGDSRALGTDLSTASGQYIIATPTTADTTDEFSGVWFVDPSDGSASLSLPTLPDGWAYEGWVVLDGTPLSTGKFTSVSGSDQSAPYSGTEAAPMFPGEDLVANAPAGLTFPTDLQGRTVVISVEPVPDNAVTPFSLKPIVGQIPSSVVIGNLYNMDNNSSATNATGTAVR